MSDQNNSTVLRRRPDASDETVETKASVEGQVAADAPAEAATDGPIEASAVEAPVDVPTEAAAGEVTAVEASVDSTVGDSTVGDSTVGDSAVGDSTVGDKTGDDAGVDEPEPEQEETGDSMGDFAALLAGGVGGAPIEQGAMVTGKLIAISGGWAFIDLGAKTEGILDVKELHDDEGNVAVALGDEVEALVTSLRGGEIRLSKTLGQQIRDLEDLADAFEVGLPVEGRVIGTNKGGFEVRIAGRNAFCPISQIEMGFTEDPNLHVNKKYRFRIMELRNQGKRIVVSRAALLREEAEAKKAELLAELIPGMELDGVVSSVQDYGAFVDLGGIEGLVHVSELAWTRVENPRDEVEQGQKLRVKVLGVKDTDKGPRISLSVREMTPHPWVLVGTKFIEGGTYDGQVMRLEPYGAFIQLSPGIEGLAHVSELSWERRVNHPNEMLTVGDQVKTYIKSIDYDRNRIALSIKALQANPWDDAGERYRPGTQVKGKVEKVQTFGVFVEVEPGITALIPASESNTGQGTDLRREFTIGKEVTAVVLSVEPARNRMSLSLKAAGEFEDQKAVNEYMVEQAKEVKKGFGTFGDLFKDKLK